MYVETHNNLGQPQQIECTRLVIRDIHHTPVAIAIQSSPEQMFVLHAGEAGFENALKALGINDTVVINRFDKAAFPKPPGELILP